MVLQASLLTRDFSSALLSTSRRRGTFATADKEQPTKSVDPRGRYLGNPTYGVDDVRPLANPGFLAGMTGRSNSASNLPRGHKPRPKPQPNPPTPNPPPPPEE